MPAGTVAVALGVRRVVDERVGAAGERDHGVAGPRVRGVNDAPAPRHVHPHGEVRHGAVLVRRGPDAERSEIEGVDVLREIDGTNREREHARTLERTEQAEKTPQRFDMLRPAIDGQRRLPPEHGQVPDERRQPVRMIGMDVRDDDRHKRLRVHAGASEFLEGASAAVDQQGAVGHHDDDRRRIADGRRDRARRAEKGEVHQRDLRLAGSKRPSAGFVLIATERTVNRIRSVPPANTSCRYGK